MKTFHTLVLPLMVILNSIELSSQFDCLPNGDPIPGVPLCRPYDSLKRHSPERTPSHARSQFPVRPSYISKSPLRGKSRSPSPAEASFRIRTRSPPAKLCLFRLIGYKQRDLELIRLIPNTNPRQRFEIRRYTFPADKKMQLRGTGRSYFRPMPTNEQNVLTTSTGDVVAMFGGNSYLRGIYDYAGKRVGINMKSGEVIKLDPELLDETPLGTRNTISKHFGVVHLKEV